MKRNVLKRIKKIILFCTVFITCFVLVTFSVSADTLPLFNLNFSSNSFAIPGLNNQPTTGVEFFDNENLSDFLNTSTKYYQKTTKFYVNANIINDRLYFSSKFKNTLLRKNMTFSGTLTGFHFGWIVITDPSNGTVGYIWLNENVNLDLYIYFLDSQGVYHSVPVSDFSFSNSDGGKLTFNCPYVPVDSVGFMFNFVYNVDDDALIDERAKMPLGWFIRNSRVYSHDLSLQGFNVDFNYSYPPLSEQPNYSEPSSGTTSDLEGLESELIGSTNSAAQEEINKSFNFSVDLIQKWAHPISAFRDAFNYFVNSHTAIFTICIITLVIGVFLLFSNFVPRGRDK